MHTIYPDFYPHFICKAGACRHSCCRESWEIDIDDATAAYYQSIDGPLGDDLRRAMVNGPDGWYFSMDGGACSFLRPDGLCRLVLELGEESLCDICAVHPRFYEVVTTADGDDLELGGAGLCCEKTCELLLAGSGDLSFYDEERPGKEIPFSDLLCQLGLDDAADSLHFAPKYDAASLQTLVDTMARTEPIDDAWTAHLKDLQQNLTQLKTALSTFLTAHQDACDRICQYITYRHLEAAAPYPAGTLARYAAMNTLFIALSAIQTRDLPESLRRWSEQIEYDTDNVDFLLHAAERVCSLQFTVPSHSSPS